MVAPEFVRRVRNVCLALVGIGIALPAVVILGYVRPAHLALSVRQLQILPLELDAQKIRAEIVELGLKRVLSSSSQSLDEQDSQLRSLEYAKMHEFHRMEEAVRLKEGAAYETAASLGRLAIFAGGILLLLGCSGVIVLLFPVARRRVPGAVIGLIAGLVAGYVTVGICESLFWTDGLSGFSKELVGVAMSITIGISGLSAGLGWGAAIRKNQRRGSTTGTTSRISTK